MKNGAQKQGEILNTYDKIISEIDDIKTQLSLKNLMLLRAFANGLLKQQSVPK